MKIDRFFKFFLPKESKFFPLLRAQVDTIVEAADLLIAFYKTPGESERETLYEHIKALEKRCDGYTTEILDELNETFITPFDREDIHTLASQLDDVLDLINTSAKRVVMYRPKVLSPSMVAMAECVKEMCIALQTAVYELEKVKKNPDVVKEQCRLLHTLENKADDIYENFIRALINHETDPIELRKQDKIIAIVEDASDKAYKVVDILKTIVVKYA